MREKVAERVTDRAEEMLRLATMIEKFPEWYATEFDEQILVDALRFAARADELRKVTEGKHSHDTIAVWEVRRALASEVNNNASLPPR